MSKPFAALVPLLLAACTAVTGLDKLSVGADSDAAAPLVEAGTSPAPGDSGMPLQPSTQDASSDARAGCTIPEFAATRPTAAVHAATAPAIDGDPSDWPCAFATLDSASAGKVFRSPLSTAQFALQWSADAITFACRVFDATPEGTDPKPYANDACELYLGPLPVGDGGVYRPSDVHIAVDWQNQAVYYPDLKTSAPPPAGFVSAVKVVPGGFTVELSVPASILGLVPAATMALAFDAQVDDAQGGVAQAGVLFAYANPASDLASCLSAASHQPTCDTRLWGELDLEP